MTSNDYLGKESEAEIGLNLVVAVFFFNLLMFFCIIEREREGERETEHEQRRGRERERETQNLKQAPGSELSAQSLMGLKPRNYEIMTLAEVRHVTEPPTCPHI